MNFEKLEKLVAMLNNINKRIASCEEYANSKNTFHVIRQKANQKLKWYKTGKLCERIERMITKELIEHISFEYLCEQYPTELLDNIDNDVIWSYMDDAAEDYVDSVCKVRYTKEEVYL